MQDLDEADTTTATITTTGTRGNGTVSEPTGNVCPVCLEGLTDVAGELVACLPACSHKFHETCISTWSERTNSCPVCRTPYNAVALAHEPDGVTVRTILFEDRKAPPPAAEDMTPEEVALYTFEEEEQVYDVDLVDPDWECALCLTGDDAHRQLACRGCTELVHVSTADADEFPFVNWCCPFCLTRQLSYLNAAFTARRRRQAARRRGPRTSRAAREWQDRFAGGTRSGVARRGDGRSSRQSARTSASASPSRSPAGSGSGSGSGSRSGSGSGSAAVSPDVSPAGSPGLPSSPREPRWSPEEMQSWDMLEQAQSALDDSGDIAPTTEPGPSSRGGRLIPGRAEPQQPREHHRLKRPSRRGRSSATQPEEAPASATLPSDTDAGVPTLVQSLLCDIRSNASPVAPPPGPPLLSSSSRPNAAVSSSASPTPMASPSPLASPQVAASPAPIPSPPMAPPPPLHTAMSPASSAASPTAAASPSRSPTPDPGRGLTLERKEQLQRMVRDALRPEYRSGRIDKDQYTRINRRVSRSLYGLVGSDANRPVTASVVAEYIQTELGALSR